MSRILFQILLPLILPLVVYALWTSFTRRRSGLTGLPGWEEGNWFWAAAAGFALAAASVIFLATTGDQPGGTYIAPHLEDGRVVPGRVERDK